MTNPLFAMMIEPEAEPGVETDDDADAGPDAAEPAAEPEPGPETGPEPEPEPEIDPNLKFVLEEPNGKTPVCVCVVVLVWEPNCLANDNWGKEEVEEEVWSDGTCDGSALLLLVLLLLETTNLFKLDEEFEKDEWIEDNGGNGLLDIEFDLENENGEDEDGDGVTKWEELFKPEVLAFKPLLLLLLLLFSFVADVIVLLLPKDDGANVVDVGGTKLFDATEDCELFELSDDIDDDLKLGAGYCCCCCCCDWVTGCWTIVDVLEYERIEDVDGLWWCKWCEFSKDWYALGDE